MVFIKWHGHSCFEIWSENLPRLLIDPHDGYSIGLKPPKTGKIDLVLITHDHFDHNYYKPYENEGARIVKWKTGEIEFNGIHVKGIKVPHDEAEGTERGFVSAYKIRYENLTILHLGDIGTEKLDESIVKEISGSHIVMIPVGGVYTIGPIAATRLLQKLNPNIVFPMHYWITGMTLPIDPIDRFLNFSRFRKYRFEENYVEINKDSLPEPVSVFILKYRNR